MSKNTNIADLINYISVDGSGNVVLTTGGQVATQSYVTTALSNLVNAAPSTLDTLNELAAALGNDANFATTVTNSIATKLPLSGGTLTGALNGTSATFSGAYGTSNGISINGTTYATLNSNRGASSASAGVNYSSIGTQKWFTGIYENSDNFGFYSVGFNGFPLTLNYSSGAAAISAIDTSGNRTSPFNVLTLTADNNSNPYNGFGAALVFKNMIYSGGPSVGGIQNGARIRTNINTNSTDAFGTDLVFDVTSTQNGSFTTAMTLRYNGSAIFPSNITANRFYGTYSSVLNTHTTVNPSSNVLLMSSPNDRDSWIFLDQADGSSNWGIYHRQIDSAIGTLEGNSIAFIGGGDSSLKGYISLNTGNAYFSSKLTLNSASGALGSQGSLNFAYSPANASSRSWRVSTDQISWGDFAIQCSSTQTGGIANTAINITKEGKVTFPSATSQNYGQSNASAVTITNGTSGTIASCTITSVGKPIFINLTGDINPIGGASWCYIYIYRNGGQIGKYIIAESPVSSTNIPFALSVIDVPGAGSHTYTGYVTVNGAVPIVFGETGNGQAPTILAIELI